jgi:hypothetical protein
MTVKDVSKLGTNLLFFFFFFVFFFPSHSSSLYHRTVSGRHFFIQLLSVKYDYNGLSGTSVKL